MSYVEIFKVQPDGQVVVAFEVRNAMAGALFIWEQLREKYRVGSVMNYDPLWKMFTGDVMAIPDQIVMGMTFDKVIIKRDTLPATIKALEEFTSRNHTGTLAGITVALKKLYDDPECAGVCFNHTSGSETYWWKPGEGEEEGRWYDINRDTGHWYLFDELPAEATVV